MTYQDMILEVSDTETTHDGDKRIGTFKVRVLTSPAGDMPSGDAVIVEYDDKDLQSTLDKLDRRELDTEGLIRLGRTLAALLLPITAKDGATSVREFFARSRVKLGPDIGLRMRLRLPPDLAVLPWEYAYIERTGGSGMDGFLALDPRIAIVRHETLAAPVAETALSGDIKIVTAFAEAGGLDDLDLDEEMNLLKEALQGVDGIRIEPCPQATLSKLQPLLPGAGIFHFAGHGDFTRQMGAKPGTYAGVGFLAFGDERIDAEQMGLNLRGQGIRLAVLAGCHTGRRDGISVWSGIAPALVKMEIPAVVANQYTITDKCAVAFSHQFYQALAGGLSIERAVSAGRIAAYNADKSGRDWGVPVLYLRAADGQLFYGAAHPTARERCRKAAEADVAVRANEVNVKVGTVSGGQVIGEQVNRRAGDTIHGNQMNVAAGGQVSNNTGVSGTANFYGPVTINQGNTGAPSSAGTPHDPSRDDVASTNTGLRLLLELRKEPEVADVVSRSKEVFEGTYRQTEKLGVFKTVHDALHEIEFRCLRPIEHSKRTDPLRLFQRDFKSIADRIKKAIQNEHVNYALRRELVEQLEAVAIAFQEAVLCQETSDCHQRLIGELKVLLSGFLARLNSGITDAAEELKLDRLVGLMKAVQEKVSGAGPVLDKKLAPFLQGINALQRLRDELSMRVSEHTHLQCLDSKLRTVCTGKNLPGTLGREWGRVIQTRSRLQPPFFPEFEEVNHELLALEALVTEAVTKGNEQEALDSMREYFGIVAIAFRGEDTSLKEFCSRLSKVSLPLNAILEVC